MAVCSGAKNTTTSASDGKDKRQINQHTRVLPVASATPQTPQTQTIYGHHTAGQYVTRPRQVQHEQPQQHAVEEQQQQLLEQEVYF